MTESSQKWIETGYQMFAETGPGGFNVEKLAILVGLNKSGFYHYFIDRDIFFQELMDYHCQMGEKFAIELSQLNEFLPGYINLLVKYSTPVQIQIQLRRNFNIQLFKVSYYKVKNRNNVFQIPLWAKYLDIKDLQLANELFEIISDLIATRHESNKVNIDFLKGIFEGMKITIDKIRKQN